MLAVFRLENFELTAAAAALLALISLARRPQTRAAPLPELIVLTAVALSVLTRTTAAHALLLMLAAFAAYRCQRRLTAADARRARPRAVASIAVILLLAAPAWHATRTDFERPVLVMLLDQSRSMSIVDPGAAGGLDRAALGSRALAAARDDLQRLESLYELERFAIGAAPAALPSATLAPREEATDLAAALRAAAGVRTAAATPPAAVLVVSDGAENVAPLAEIHAAADALAQLGVPLLVAAVGPPPGALPTVALDPLRAPSRVSSRERLRFAVSLRATGCAGQALDFSATWGDSPPERRTIPIAQADQIWRAALELPPQRPGLHLLRVAVTLPTALGGDTLEQSTLVDVHDARIRVAWVDRAPRFESAFVGRTLRADPRFEFHLVTLPDSPAAAPAPEWHDYDVVILGDVPPERLAHAALDRLAGAVTREGVGLLLTGAAVWQADSLSRSDLADVAPVQQLVTIGGNAAAARLRAAAISDHELLPAIGLAAGASIPAAASLSAMLGARLGAPKPLAAAILVDESDRAALVAHEVGRGRVAAAAWATTWPAALRSEEGLAAHRALWRGLAAWLANRRPSAWVVSDAPRYSAAVLRSGQRDIRIRAGVRGLELPASAQPTLQLVPLPESASGPAPQTIALERLGEEFHARLSAGTADWVRAGRFELRFAVAAPSAASAEPLQARAGFELSDDALEFRKPTTNRALLESLAQRTKSSGGRIVEVADLKELLTPLLATDRRRRIETLERATLTHWAAWPLLAAVVAGYGWDWAQRRRAGRV